MKAKYYWTYAKDPSVHSVWADGRGDPARAHRMAGAGLGVSGQMQLGPYLSRCLIPSQSHGGTSLAGDALELCCDRSYWRPPPNTPAVRCCLAYSHTTSRP